MRWLPLDAVKEKRSARFLKSKNFRSEIGLFLPDACGIRESFDPTKGNSHVSQATTTVESNRSI